MAEFQAQTTLVNDVDYESSEKRAFEHNKKRIKKAMKKMTTTELRLFCEIAENIKSFKAVVNVIKYS